MKQLQNLLGEANQFLEHAGFKISVPLGQEGVFYEVSETAFGLPQGIGRIAELQSDYGERKGIGVAVPPITGLPDVLTDTQDAATKIVAIQEKYIDALHDMSHLCNHHVINPHSHSNRVKNGGILRIHIEARSAVFQILFPIAHGLYSVAYEGSLGDVIDGQAFHQKPFSQIPPNFMIPDGQTGGHFVPATHDNIILADSLTPLNARSKKTPYKSRSSEVFRRFSDMVEELMSA